MKITLLMTFQGLTSPMHMLNQLYSLEHDLSASFNPLNNFSPTNWDLTLPSLKHLNGIFVNTCMINVLGELNERKVGITTPTKFQYKCPKHIFKGLYTQLVLTTGLWAVNGVEMKSCTQLLMKLSPESRGKRKILIGNHMRLTP